ncbi:FadR/GntR family transcriptional regulator [Verrucosispora sp. WMMA2044]|uniref:FadR family transcriptional regulator n=1 Tax=Verrucosispora sioxanthis TaxID=2499994 RepID=A0A6M1KR79_9ACTN|nr:MULTISPECIES: FadR/GntR family transcriptional regulator [Micromonospora]NEE62425.1 FadR family transcriptional regulator [Verrucosispora sioxanthis]NGM11535.1 FadR family transcriptional regulator [Verrucosispora sioxanthis]WBB46775.1 FadR/GntR family transcriptional regulator [Verrucosispora sp. WMMA2044]
MTPSQETALEKLAAPTWSRRPTNLATAVTAELVERIVRGVHPSGTALPPEPVLCETFSVSRTVVREAVKILQEKGLVQVRQGAGTMVTPQSMWDMLDELVLGATIAEDDSLAILDDVVVTRRLLESDMAHVAARVADEETVDRLRALVDRMDELVGDTVAYHELDRAFHDTVMQASGNRIARGVVQALESQVVNTARYTGRTERSLCVASNRGHRRVYEMIAAHDPEGAATAMFTHITEAWLVRRSGPGKPDRLQR